MPWGKGRQPDKPGTYRIRPAKTGGMRLSGVKADGTRVRVGGLSQSDADELARKLFPSVAKPVVASLEAVREWSELDDWGLPKVGDEAAASIRQTLNLPDPNAPKPTSTVAPPQPSREEIEKKERRAKNAKSLMDLGSIAFAAGDVMLGRKLCDALDKVAVKPDTQQVNDLRDSFKETLVEWFGDSEISPWKMTLLLAIGIPLSMMLQSPQRKRLPQEESGRSGSNQSAPLKSVP